MYKTIISYLDSKISRRNGRVITSETYEDALFNVGLIVEMETEFFGAKLMYQIFDEQENCVECKVYR